jgi:hypothetical protein
LTLRESLIDLSKSSEISFLSFSMQKNSEVVNTLAVIVQQVDFKK